ncbi:MAG: hypothetical protein RLZ92_1859 [Pseudomonadota bacterium]|jgi:hypothetical protein
MFDTTNLNGQNIRLTNHREKAMKITEINHDELINLVAEMLANGAEQRQTTNAIITTLNDVFVIDTGDCFGVLIEDHGSMVNNLSNP